jgi:hypothetical protein
MEERVNSDVITSLIITADECYAILASTPEGRKILIPRDLVCRIEAEWQKKNFVSLKMGKEISIRRDNVYLCDGMELDIKSSEKLPIAVN